MGGDEQSTIHTSNLPRSCQSPLAHFAVSLWPSRMGDSNPNRVSIVDERLKRPCKAAGEIFKSSWSRYMRFLYSLLRLGVGGSRTKCAK